MKVLITVLSILLTVSTVFALDGTFEGAAIPTGDEAQKQSPQVRQTDDTYVISPFESVNTGTAVWTDNRHRAYYNTSGTVANGFLLFDVSSIPDGSTISSMTLRCYLENAYGSPSNNPVVDIYHSPDDGWTRSSVTATSLTFGDLVVDDVPFSSYTTYYDFNINVAAHDWSQDLVDNQICLGFNNDVNYYSYVYFFGAYGTPAGPAPELTIETGGGGPYDLVVDLTYVAGSPVPANGGNLEFAVFVENMDPDPANFDGWLAVEWESGAPTTLASRYFANFMPGWTVNRPDMYYPVPGSWEAGSYEFFGRVGDEPGDVWAEDSFAFTKSGVSDNPEFQPWPVAGAPDPFDRITKPEETTMPAEFGLTGNYPNPFNPTTTLNFNLPEAAAVSLVVYDLQGREVARLVDGWRTAGSHQATFDATGLASGVYIYQLTSGSDQQIGKMMLLK